MSKTAREMNLLVAEISETPIAPTKAPMIVAEAISASPEHSMSFEQMSDQEKIS